MTAKSIGTQIAIGVAVWLIASYVQKKISPEKLETTALPVREYDFTIGRSGNGAV